MNIASLDLNLLKAFVALFEHRNVTRAAEAMGLAQPSMSNALSRLRAVTGDDLFVRAPGLMIPTERAEAMAPQITQAVSLVVTAFTRPEAFDPQTATARVTIAAPDSVVLTLAPALAQILRNDAPGIDLRFRSMDKATLWDELDRDVIDLAVGRLVDIPARFHTALGPSDDFAVVSDGSFADPLTLRAYCEASHVLVSFAGDGRGAIDDALSAIGLTRRIALTVAQFAVVPAIVASTGYLATIPRRVASEVIPQTGCRLHDLPLPQERWSLNLAWSARSEASPAKRYVIDRVSDVI